MAVLERWATGSGVRIRYLDNAPPSPEGLPVVFVPGVTDTADEYLEVLEWFGPRRLVVAELRGRGGSDAPTDGYESDRLADDVLAVVADAGITIFHLMTFSRGTTAGLLAMLRDPDRVVSVSIGDYWAREVGLDASMADHLLATRFRGKPMTDRVQSHVLPALFAASRERDLCPALAATGLPVLLAAGTEPGRLADDAVIATYRRHVPGVQVVTIPGAGHDLFRPDRLAYPRAVAAFAERTELTVLSSDVEGRTLETPDHGSGRKRT